MILQKQILLNLAEVLQASGLGLENVVKANIYLTDLEDFAEMNDAYTSFFPSLKPVSILIA